METSKLAGEMIDAEMLLAGRDPYADQRSFEYLYNFYKNTDVKSATAYRFCFMLNQYYPGYIWPKQPAAAKAKGARAAAAPARMEYTDNLIDPSGQVPQEEWDHIGKALEIYAQRTEEVKPSMTLTALHKIADHLNFDSHSHDILEFSHVSMTGILLSLFFRGMTRNQPDRWGVALSRFMDKPEDYKAYGKALDNNAPLIKFDILTNASVDTDQGELDLLPPVNPTLLEGISHFGDDVEAILRRLTGEPVTTELDLHKDFGHLGDMTDLVEQTKRAVEGKQVGYNIMINGPSGSGKSALARALAKELGYNLYVVGEIPEDGDPDKVNEITSRRRARHARQLDALLEGVPNTMLLFEEMEDMQRGKGELDNKVEFLGQLTGNKVPCIYTCNDIDLFKEPVRRRFKNSVYADYPPTLVRQRIWQRQCELNGVSLTEDQTLKLARKYSAPPALMADAVENAKGARDAMAAIEKSLDASAKTVYGLREAIEVDNPVPPDFSPASVNAGPGTEEKIANLIARGKAGQPFSLFVQGKKGAGAGSMVRFISERLSKNLSELSMETVAAQTSVPAEKRISTLFEQATDLRQILVLNDIEYLKDTPGSAGSKWDSDLTTAFLKAAQAHKLPFVITTTKDEELPPELDFILTDKMKLDALTGEAAENAYKRFFQREAPPSLADRKSLLPGDFAEVAKLASRYGSDSLPNERILELLDRRLQMRKEPVTMGFSPARR